MHIKLLRAADACMEGKYGRTADTFFIFIFFIFILTLPLQRPYVERAHKTSFHVNNSFDPLREKKNEISSLYRYRFLNSSN